MLIPERIRATILNLKCDISHLSHVLPVYPNLSHPLMIMCTSTSWARELFGGDLSASALADVLSLSLLPFRESLFSVVKFIPPDEQVPRPMTWVAFATLICGGIFRINGISLR